MTTRRVYPVHVSVRNPAAFWLLLILLMLAGIFADGVAEGWWN
jgi:hypothetical protein